MALLPFKRTLASSGQRPTNGAMELQCGVASLRGFSPANSIGGGSAHQQQFRFRPTPARVTDSTIGLAKKGIIDFDDNAVDVKGRILEAILLIAKEPLSARKLAALAGLVDPTQARTLARRLNEQYELHGHAFRIEELAGGMQLLTRPQFAVWLRRLDHVPREELLSQGMLESLAIIAYRQPLLRAEIEAIRGVSCDEVLRQLMQRDLVRICGRHEDLGRPYLYGTTKRFLLLFGLQSLDSLPRAQKIRSAEADIVSRLAGNCVSEQDIGEKLLGKMGIHPSPTAEHH